MKKEAYISFLTGCKWLCCLTDSNFVFIQLRCKKGTSFCIGLEGGDKKERKRLILSSICFANVSKYNIFISSLSHSFHACGPSLFDYLLSPKEGKKSILNTFTLFCQYLAPSLSTQNDQTDKNSWKKFTLMVKYLKRVVYKTRTNNLTSDQY